VPPQGTACRHNVPDVPAQGTGCVATRYRECRHNVPGCVATKHRYVVTRYKTVSSVTKLLVFVPVYQGVIERKR
jgi:hypothetical protein